MAAHLSASRAGQVALALALAAGSIGCGNGDDATAAPIGTDGGLGGEGGQSALPDSLGADFTPAGHGSPGAETGTWTYLVYMIADNPLEAFARERVEELMQVGSRDGVTILAQIDRAAGQSNEPFGNLAEFTGAKRLRVDPGNLVDLYPTAPLGAVNSGSGATFAAFLNWGIQTAPADHYAVLLWDHGAAWSHFGADGSGQNDGLDLNELTRALDVAIAANGLLGPFDLIGFDACLLGTWEVATALAGRARYLLASEELQPGHGWDFRSLAIGQEGAQPLTLGSALLEGYAAKARARGTFARITLALTDLNRIGPLDARVAELAGALSVASSDRSLATAIGRSRASMGVFGSVPRGISSSMVDLRLWSGALADEHAELSPTVQAVQQALDNAIVARVAGDAHASTGGLSIYLPSARNAYDRTYDELSDVSEWRDFLTGYLEAGRTLEPVPSFAIAGDRATVTSASGRLIASGPLAQGSFGQVTETAFAFGLFASDGTAFLLGEKPATLDIDGMVRGEWDGRALELSQEGLTDYAAYVIEPASGGASTVSIPLEYTDDDEVSNVVLVAALDDSGEVLSQRFYQPIGGAWAERALAPGSTLAAIVPTIAPGGSDLAEIAQSATFDGELPLRLELVPVGSGTPVFVRLRVVDYGGHADTLDGTGTL